jgi:hypothetical protein
MNGHAVTQDEAIVESVLRVCRQHDDSWAPYRQAVTPSDRAPWLPRGVPCRTRGFPLPDVLMQFTRLEFLRT